MEQKKQYSKEDAKLLLGADITYNDNIIVMGKFIKQALANGNEDSFLEFLYKERMAYFIEAMRKEVPKLTDEEFRCFATFVAFSKGDLVIAREVINLLPKLEKTHKELLLSSVKISLSEYDASAKRSEAERITAYFAFKDSKDKFLCDFADKLILRIEGAGSDASDALKRRVEANIFSFKQVVDLCQKIDWHINYHPVKLLSSLYQMSIKQKTRTKKHINQLEEIQRELPKIGLQLVEKLPGFSNEFRADNVFFAGWVLDAANIVADNPECVKNMVWVFKHHFVDREKLDFSLSLMTDVLKKMQKAGASTNELLEICEKIAHNHKCFDVKEVLVSEEIRKFLQFAMCLQCTPRDHLYLHRVIMRCQWQNVAEKIAITAYLQRAVHSVRNSVAFVTVTPRDYVVDSVQQLVVLWRQENGFPNDSFANDFFWDIIERFGLSLDIFGHDEELKGRHQEILDAKAKAAADAEKLKELKKDFGLE